MKKTLIAIMACVFLAGWSAAGCCQDKSIDDRAIEQGESQMSQTLDSEMASDQAEDDASIAEMEASMDSGGQTN